MSSYNVKGKVTRIGDLLEKGTFKKRDLIIVTDEQYPQTIAIEFVKDKEQELDFIEVGETVSVDCNLRGREWKDPKGVLKYFLSLQSWKTEKIK